MVNLTRNEKYKEFPLIILGHPRCGSRSLAMAFSKIGVQLGHERLDVDGMVSWWHTSRAVERHAFNNGNIEPNFFFANIVAHYVRNPLDAIPSIIIENEFNKRQNNSFKYRENVILNNFNVKISSLSPLGAATASYVLWNDLARSQSDFESPIMIERPLIFKILEKMNSDTNVLCKDRIIIMPKLNTTKKKFKKDKELITKSEILDSANDEIRERLEYYLELYEI